MEDIWNIELLNTDCHKSSIVPLDCNSLGFDYRESTFLKIKIKSYNHLNKWKLYNSIFNAFELCVV